MAERIAKPRDPGSPKRIHRVWLGLGAERERGDYLPTKPESPPAEIGEDFWQNAHVVMPPGRASVHLRVKCDVLEWFKAQGKGHLTRMNAVLRKLVTTLNAMINSRQMFKIELT